MGVVRPVGVLGAAVAVAALLAACADTAPAPGPPAPAPPAATAAPPPALGPARVIAPGRPGEPARVLPGAGDTGSADVVTPADVAFVTAMIPHHEQALLMAGLAPTRAADPRVRAMADRITGVQSAEIAMLRTWAERHGAGGHAGRAPGGMGEMAGMASPAQLDALAAASGPAFDRSFLDLMTAHHEGALAMARRVQVEGRDVTALQIADDVVATQSADIVRMRGMYPA